MERVREAPRVGLLTSSFSPGAHCPSLGGWGGIKTFRVFMLFTADPTVGRGRGMVWVWNASLRGIFWIYVDSTRGAGVTTGLTDNHVCFGRSLSAPEVSALLLTNISAFSKC